MTIHKNRFIPVLSQKYVSVFEHTNYTATEQKTQLLLRQLTLR